MFRFSGGPVGVMLVSGGRFSGLARCGTSAGGAGAATGSAGGGASGAGGGGSHGNAGAGGAAGAGAAGAASAGGGGGGAGAGGGGGGSQGRAKAGGGGGGTGTAGSAIADGVPSISAAIPPTPTVANDSAFASMSNRTDAPFPTTSLILLFARRNCYTCVRCDQVVNFTGWPEHVPLRTFCNRLQLAPTVV
jgi:hypothetical protein